MAEANFYPPFTPFLSKHGVTVGQIHPCLISDMLPSDLPLSDMLLSGLLSFVRACHMHPWCMVYACIWYFHGVYK